MKHRRLGDLSCMLKDNELYSIADLCSLWEASKDTIYSQIKKHAIPVAARREFGSGRYPACYYLGRNIKEALIKRQDEKDKARGVRMRYRRKQRIAEATIDDTENGAITQGKFLVIKRQNETVTDKYDDPEATQELAEVYNLLLDIKDIFPDFGQH